SYSNIINLLIVRINLNPFFTGDISPQLVDSGLCWIQGWFRKSQSIDSLFTMAAYWRMSMKLRLTIPNVSVKTEDDFEDIGPIEEKEGFDTCIQMALSKLSPRLLAQIQGNDALLNALANPYTRKILSCININDSERLNIFFVLELEKIEQLCRCGS